MKDSRVIAGLTVCYLLLLLGLAWQIRDRVLAGTNDFVTFYVAGRSLGTGDLYNAERARELDILFVGVTSPAWRYIRLPIHAIFFWPLARLPYRAAYVLWEALLVAALGSFAWLWRPTLRSATLVYLSLSLPSLVSLLNAQDVPLLLVWLAISTSLERRGASFASGAVLSLCTVKVHLFVLVPLLLVTQKEWRLLRGLLAGGVALLAVCFVAAGPSWPLQFYTALRDPNISPNLGSMPNLHGLFSPWPSAWPLEGTCAMAVVAAVWLIARRMSFEYALAATLAGGLLLSYHSYLSDCSLLLPAALTVLYATESASLRFVALLLLLPFAYFLLLFPSPLPALVPLTILLFVFLMAREAWRHSGVLRVKGDGHGPAAGPAVLR